MKPIFEEDFPEKGMKAWLTDIEWCVGEDCYKLHFDFTEFEAENLKYFKEVFYTDTPGKLVTAIKAGCYKAKYSVYFSTSDNKRNDALFMEEIKQHLRVIE